MTSKEWTAEVDRGGVQDALKSGLVSKMVMDIINDLSEIEQERDQWKYAAKDAAEQFRVMASAKFEAERERNEWKAMADKASQALVEYMGIKEAAEDRALKAEAQLARCREEAEELLIVADLRGDSDLPHPSNDEKLWTARMQDAWDGLRAVLAEGDKT